MRFVMIFFLAMSLVGCFNFPENLKDIKSRQFSVEYCVDDSPEIVYQVIKENMERCFDYYLVDEKTGEVIAESPGYIEEIRPGNELALKMDISAWKFYAEHVEVSTTASCRSKVVVRFMNDKWRAKNNDVQEKWLKGDTDACPS